MEKLNVIMESLEGDSNNLILIEGAMGDFLRNILKGGSKKTLNQNLVRDIEDALRTEFRKTLNSSKGNSKMTASVLTKSLPYKDGLTKLIKELSQVKYGKSFDKLTKIEQDATIKEARGAIETQVSTIAKEESAALGKQAKDLGSAIGPQHKKTLRAKKLEAKALEMDRIFKNLPTPTQKEILSLLKKQKTTVTKTKTGTIRKIWVNASTLKKLAAVGIFGLGLYWIYSRLFPSDELILVDDNDKPIPDNDKPITPPTPPSDNGEYKFKYVTCNEFPFDAYIEERGNQGCKNDKIKEIQTCLGLEPKYQTGNFGPITLSKLVEVSKSMGFVMGTQITEEIYNIVKENCGGNDEVPLTDTSVSSEPTGNTVNQNPELSSTPAEITQLQKDEIIGRLRKRTLLNDFIYKGPDLEPNEKAFLDEYMKNQYGSYYETKEKDKRYGQKYIYKKQKKETALNEEIKKTRLKTINESFNNFNDIEGDKKKRRYIFNAIYNLNKNGYSEEEIDNALNEGIGDTIKNWFAEKLRGGVSKETSDKAIDATGGGMISQFKTYAIYQVLSFFGLKGPLAEAVSAVLADMSPWEIVSVYRSRAGCDQNGQNVVTSLLEGVVKYFTHSEDVTPGSVISGFLQNSMAEYFRTSNASKSLKDLLCNALHKEGPQQKPQPQETNEIKPKGFVK